MLTALIRKDDSTEVPRQVEDMAAARALIVPGMTVSILQEDGSKTPVEADAVEEETAAEEPPAELS